MGPVELLRAHLEFEVEYRAAPAGKHPPAQEWATRQLETIARYKMLSEAQAVATGNMLLDAYDRLASAELRNGSSVLLKDIPVTELYYLAAFQRDAMRNIYPGVIAREIFWSGDIYCAGDAATRDALLARLALVEVEPGLAETSPDGWNILQCLAWIGDEVVVSHFASWHDVRMIWRPTPKQVEVTPSLAGTWRADPIAPATREAGWEMTDDERRRNLYSEGWCKLISPEQGVDTESPVSVGAPLDEVCTWCGRPLATILDLDVQTGDFAFLGLHGQQLRVPACRWCSYGGGIDPLFWRADATGEASWHPANGERPEIGAQYDDDNWADEPPWVNTPYALSAQQTRPFSSLVPDGDFSPNRLGGLPGWVQYPQHPRCPDCGKSMRFICQLDADEHGGWEGLLYVLLCAECGVAATVHQQT
jgi:hypothetical protein